MQTLFDPAQSAGLQPLPIARAASGAADSSGSGSFGETLRAALDKTETLQREADQAIKDTATGKPVELHQTMIAMEQADLQFQLVMQVRNKLVAAYEEISRMQV